MQAAAGEAPPLPLPITQIAIVVHDIRDALARYHRALGWGPWNVYEHAPPTLHDTVLHGKPTEYSMIGAETHAGPIVVELLQPLEGPSIYKEWLEEHGEGLHHIAVMRPTPEESDATKQHFADLGAKVLMGGRIGASIEFYYLDTEPQLKVILESGTGHAVDLKPAWTYPV
ncbi:MAG: VOC family protein [Solirubrobacterales bacterium]|nr:VOC family protein [Solirubrobacterales bacterium]